MTNQLRNQRGDMLLSAIVAIAIFGVAMAAMMTYSESIMTNIRSLNFQLQAAEKLVAARVSLSKANGCTLNLVGKKLPAINAELDLPALYFAKTDGSGLTADAIAKVGENNQGMTLHSMKVKPVRQLTAQSYLASIDFNFRMNSVYTPSLIRGITVNLDVDGSGQITTCAVSGSTDGLAGGSCEAKTTMMHFAHKGGTFKLPAGKLTQIVSPVLISGVDSGLETTRCTCVANETDKPDWDCVSTLKPRSDTGGGGDRATEGAGSPY